MGNLNTLNDTNTHIRKNTEEYLSPLQKIHPQARKQAAKKLNEKIDEKLKKVDQSNITFGEVVSNW